jgi:hypothetical protein
MWQQPPFGRGAFGGIPLKPKSKGSEILDVLSLISVPSRGANPINSLRFFLVNLPRYFRADY